MENNNKLNEKIIEENDPSLIIQKEKSSSNLNPFSSSLGINSESITINDDDTTKNSYKYENEIKKLLNKIINYRQNIEKNIIFECPEQNCPFIPLLAYFEFTQSIATKCRMGHEYHLSLKSYYEIIFKKINTEKYCNICLKKNYSNIKSSSEFYCINCYSFLCRRCELIHNNEHQILEISKINTYCPIHETKKFSGYCSKCQKDICILCLKEHSGAHHCLVKYLELIPSKDMINNYRNQIKNEMEYIDLVKNILFDNNILENKNEKNMILEFFDKMKLKYYFYEEQLQTFNKIKFNICIIKNVINIFLIPQNIFKEIYTFIKSNLNEYNKLLIINKLISTVLKYQNNTKKIDKKKQNKYLSHFEFKPLFSLNKNKNIKFLYPLKCGKFIICVENDGLYIYDDGTYVELLHIISENDIIDLCEDDSGLLFLLKKSMIEIIKINENYNGYTVKNKILFKTIEKANFICSITNGSIIVSRIKRNEGNLEIWMKSKTNNNNNNNKSNPINSKDKKSKNRMFNDLPERGRNIINMFNNNNRRLEIVLRRTINNNNLLNINNNTNNINNNINNINNNINNNITNNINNTINNNITNSINNNINNNINNGNLENNNNTNNQNNNDNNDDEEENNEENDNDNDHQRNNNNENNNNENDINNDNNNINQININQNNQNNIINNFEQNNNNNNNNNNNDNDNIILQEMPQSPLIINNVQNNNNNHNNNNNGINVNIFRGNRARHYRQNPDNQRPRFVHVIRFIRDQLQGLVNNLQQEELVLEDPSLISSVGIYGSKDQEITHLNKIIKNGHEICALLDWDNNFFICSEFHVQRKSFKCIRIYSSETYEPCGNNSKIKIKNCSRDKDALIKIDNDIFGVCYDIDKTIYGLSLVSFKTREEISKIEMPKFNLIKKIYFNKYVYLFVLLDYFSKNNINYDMIKVFKIIDKELIESSSYYFESWLNTYVYNNNSEKKNENDDIGNDIGNDNENKLEEERKKDKEYKFMNIVNSFEQNNHYGKEIVSMIKLKNNSFVFLNKSHCINIYKVE